MYVKKKQQLEYMFLDYIEIFFVEWLMITPRESTAAYMISIQPLNVACKSDSKL